jgi:N-acetylmuramoyl-L-alanine amidase
MRWHGALNYLGFEPRQTNGQLFINRLDVEKSLLPFLLPGLPWERTNRTIVLDPGHGGVNGGTQSARGRLVEKNLTLDWARRLKPLLEARGWHVLMTRTNDVDMALAERVDFSEASRASLFVSLHFNSGAGNLNASGIETYCLTPVGMSSTITRDYVDDSGKAYPNNQFDAENVRLAMSVHRSLLSTTGAADRGVRRARFMDVLRWQSRPAILIEGGYLTNPTESQRLAEPAYRQKLAEAVARALD